MIKRRLFQDLYKDGTLGLWFTVRYVLFDWPNEPLKVFFKILSLLFFPVLLSIAIIQSLITVFGLLFSYIPILRDIMAFIFIILFGNLVIMPVVFISTVYNYEDYQSKLRYYNLVRGFGEKNECI